MSVRPCATASALSDCTTCCVVPVGSHWREHIYNRGAVRAVIPRDVDIWDQVEAHLHTPRARRALRRRQVVSERIFADVKVKRDQRVSSTTAQASISTLAASGSAEVAKAVRAGSDEPKKSA